MATVFFCKCFVRDWDEINKQIFEPYPIHLIKHSGIGFLLVFEKGYSNPSSCHN